MIQIDITLQGRSVVTKASLGIRRKMKSSKSFRSSKYMHARFLHPNGLRDREKMLLLCSRMRSKVISS